MQQSGLYGSTGNRPKEKSARLIGKKPRRGRVLLFLALPLLALMGLSVSQGLCAPVISGVQGTLSDKSSITITGSSFGSTGPNVVLFDDYEKGASGGTVSTASGSAQVGQWTYAIGGITYSTSYAHSGNKSGKSEWANAVSGSIPQTQLNFSSADRVFLSWWQYVPAGKVIPGTTNPSLGGTNWKTFWIWSDPFPTSDHLTVYLNDTNGPGGWSYALSGDDTSLSYNSGSPSVYRSSYLTKGVWNRYSFYFYGSSSQGAIKMYEVSSTQGFHTILDSSGVNTMRSGQLWNRLTLPGYGRKDSNSQTYVDDVYFATGAGAQARVEMGNQSSYQNCSNLAILTPTSWSNGSVTATVRQGGFAAGQSAYLFVIDANGTASAGFPVTIGAGSSGGGGTNPPPASDNPPTVSITSPTSQPTYVTSQNSITLQGTAADDKGVARISWSNSLGGSGTASNLSGDWKSWSAVTIPLQVGQNSITVTATDTAGNTGSGKLVATYSAGTGTGTEAAWSANSQTGDPTWKNSGVTYCARILVQGSQITQSGSSIKLAFQGRTDGTPYTIKEVSIAQKDPRITGNVVSGTWTKVTFDANPVSNWNKYLVTVPAGSEKVSDPITFPLSAGKDYYVTFKINSPSVYLNPPSTFQELYFWSTDYAGTANWSRLGYQLTQDYHAFSRIYVVK
jgi:hypothetical protein